MRIAIPALFAAALAALPMSGAKAQYYYPLCNPFPLSWPFCIAGAAVGTAATIATAPFRAAAGYYPYYYSPYGQYYSQPFYYGSAYYYPPRAYR